MPDGRTLRTVPRPDHDPLPPRSNGARQSDEVVHASADILCQDLIRKLTGKRASNRYFKQVTSLGEAIVEGGFRSIADLEPDEILMRYEK